MKHNIIDSPQRDIIYVKKKKDYNQKQIWSKIKKKKQNSQFSLFCLNIFWGKDENKTDNRKYFSVIDGFAK